VGWLPHSLRRACRVKPRGVARSPRSLPRRGVLARCGAHARCTGDRLHDATRQGRSDRRFLRLTQRHSREGRASGDIREHWPIRTCWPYRPLAESPTTRRRGWGGAPMAAASDDRGRPSGSGRGGAGARSRRARRANSSPGRNRCRPCRAKSARRAGKCPAARHTRTECVQLAERRGLCGRLGSFLGGDASACRRCE
jgi:hypothetical protein